MSVVYTEANMDELREYYLGELDKKDAEIERLQRLTEQYDRLDIERIAEVERLRAEVRLWKAKEALLSRGRRALGDKT